MDEGIESSIARAVAATGKTREELEREDWPFDLCGNCHRSVVSATDQPPHMWGFSLQNDVGYNRRIKLCDFCAVEVIKRLAELEQEARG